MMFDLVAHLKRQRAFSRATFGPGPRTKGVCDHIKKELIEIEAKPTDVSEWVDVVLLGLDGAWRCLTEAGFPAEAVPEMIAGAIEAKQTKNEGRDWPDWRTADPNKAIEHVRVTRVPIAGVNATESPTMPACAWPLCASPYSCGRAGCCLALNVQDEGSGP